MRDDTSQTTRDRNAQFFWTNNVLLMVQVRSKRSWRRRESYTVYMTETHTEYLGTILHQIYPTSKYHSVPKIWKGSVLVESVAKGFEPPPCRTMFLAPVVWLLHANLSPAETSRGWIIAIPPGIPGDVRDLSKISEYCALFETLCLRGQQLFFAPFLSGLSLSSLTSCTRV